MKYSKKIKIDRAKVLLTTTNKSMLDIAISLGFYDQSHFSKTFKSFEGKYLVIWLRISGQSMNEI